MVVAQLDLLATVVVETEIHLQINKHYIYIYMFVDRKTRLSMTPVYRTVQEGLSMVSCREGITKSKHVFFLVETFCSEFSPLRASSKALKGENLE